MQGISLKNSIWVEMCSLGWDVGENAQKWPMKLLAWEKDHTGKYCEFLYNNIFIYFAEWRGKQMRLKS